MYLFNNHFIKLKSPAFWCSWKNQKLGLQGVWILAGQQWLLSPGPLSYRDLTLLWRELRVYWHLSLAPLMSDLLLHVPVTGVQTKETRV